MSQPVQIVSTVVAIISLLLIWRQLRQQTKLAKFSAMIQTHQELREPRFLDALKRIHSASEVDLSDPTDHKLVNAIEIVTGVYDLMAIRLQAKALPVQFILKSEWKVLSALWPRVKNFVQERRSKRGAYKEDFEWLAHLAEEYRIRKLRIRQPTVHNEEEHRGPSLNDDTETKIMYRGEHLHFYRNNKGWEYVRRPKGREGVTILAVTPKQQVILVEQYRIPLKRNVIELPSGLVGDLKDVKSDNIEMATKRELSEETGYRCDSVKVHAHGPFLPGITDEYNAICTAEGLRKGREQGEEGIKVHRVALSKLVQWLADQEKQGKAVDLRVYAGLFFLSESQKKNIQTSE